MVMNSPQRGLKIRAELPFADVNWPLVTSVVAGNFKLGISEAEKLAAAFAKKILRPLNLYWFVGKQIAPQDQPVVSAICEVHGADSIVLLTEKTLRAGGLSLQLRQKIGFEPQFVKAEGAGKSGRCSAEAQIEICGRTVFLRSMRSVLLLQSLLFSVAVLLYVIVAGCFLYAAGVFLLFLYLPADVTLAATRQLNIYLALLCFMAGVAWIFVRAVSNVLGLGLSFLRGGQRNAGALRLRRKRLR